MDGYGNYYWMVAWAGDHFFHVNELSENTDKIRQLVVGLHFYQTSPTFIQDFNPVYAVRFIKKTSGIFHPKVFLFVNNEKDWEVLIGSANLTRSAFNRNNEACVLMSAGEVDSKFFQKIKDSIDVVWQAGTKFSQSELADYIALKGQARQPDEFGLPGAAVNPGPQQGAPIVRMNWREYMDRILEHGHGSIMQRIELLDIVKEHFEEFPIFEEMPPAWKKQIGGFVWKRQPADFRLFGNMQRATNFKAVISNHPAGISHALDTIPSEGLVTKLQYQSFVQQFRAAVGENPYRSATRLLAMKRPDLFFAISKGNMGFLAADFNIGNIRAMNFDRYWSEITAAIWGADWWLNPDPINVTERRIVPYRAAFMDVMYYEHAG